MIVAALILAALSLVVSAASVALSIVVMRQSGATATGLRQHRNAHTARDGAEDPRPPRHDRRQVNLGAPRATGERRASPGQLLPPEDTPPAALAADDAPTGAMPRVLPRPGEIGRPR